MSGREITCIPVPTEYRDFSICLIFGSFLTDPENASDIDVLYYNLRPEQVWEYVSTFLDVWGLQQYRSKRLDCTSIEVKTPPIFKGQKIEYYLPLAMGQPTNCCVIHAKGDFSICPKYITNRLTSVLKIAQWLTRVQAEYVANYMVSLLNKSDVALSFEPAPKRNSFYKKIDNYCDNRDSLIKAFTSMPLEVELLLKNKLSWYDVIVNMCLYPIKNKSRNALRNHDSRGLAMLYTQISTNGEITFRTSDSQKFYSTRFIVNYFFDTNSKLQKT